MSFVFFFFAEGRRIGLPWWLPVLLVPLSVGGAVAFTLPLFLGIRELRLSPAPPGGAGRTTR